MTIDPPFIKAVQKAGWLIKEVDADRVVGSCPHAGCGMSVDLKPGRAIPATCGHRSDAGERTIGSYTAARDALRWRRESLCLTIKEVEEVAGVTVDHLAKAEKDDPDRVISTQIFIEWAKSLGYDVVLRPTEIPPMTARYIADTRHRMEARRRIWQRQVKRRGGGG